MRPERRSIPGRPLPREKPLRAHKGMLTAAKIMACTGAELLEKPELLERIKEDWLEKLDGETYPDPLPKDVKPEIW